MRQTRPFAPIAAFTMLILAYCSLDAAFASQDSTATSKKIFSCTGNYNGIKLNLSEVKIILQRHKEWLRRFETFYKSSTAMGDARRANLCGADLSGLNMAWTNWRNADLRNARFRGADLKWADLRDSDARGADFSGAYLQNTDLRYAALTAAKFSKALLDGANGLGADMRDTDLSSAILSGATLSYSNFSGANLENAHLTATTLIGTNLEGAYLRSATVTGAIFEPIGLPSIDGIVEAYDLENLRYEHSARALSDLRIAMREAGYSTQGKAITVAINHGTLWKQGSFLENVVSTAKFLFFELPTNWGLQPNRALWFLVLESTLFGLFYIVWFRFLNKQSKGDQQTLGWINAFTSGIELSVLSSLHFGYRQYNVARAVSSFVHRGQWPPPGGWLRSVYGLQAIASLFLLAMWLTTTLGDPFG